MPSAARAERWSWKRALLLWLVTSALVALTAHPICDLVFDCGCRWAFAGGEAHCDITVPGPPDCPVCADMRVGAAFAAALMLAWGGVVWGAARVIAPGSRRTPAAP
jgi:hypothetical protein